MMTQTQKFRGVATQISKDGVWTIGTYHATPVAMFAPRIDGVTEVVLNTGGWWTATTKTRMNQFANEFDLAYQVYQKRGKWFIALPDGDHEFTSKVVRFTVPSAA